MTGVSTILIRDTPGRTTYEIKAMASTPEVRICVDDVLTAAQVLTVEPSDLRELSGFFDELARDWAGLVNA